MRLPFGMALEKRAASTGYTDAVTEALIARATGTQAVQAGATAALEAAAGLVGRSFAVAQVTGRQAVAEALTPSVLQMVGRSLVRSGEAIYLITTDGGAVELLPATSYDIYGPANPALWTYSLDIATPSGGTERYASVPAQGVLHVMANVDPSRPYRGQGSIEVASLAGRLSAEVIAALGNESAGPHGQALMTPKDGDDAGLEKLRNDIGAAKGRLIMVEAGDMDNPGADRKTGSITRYGADMPQSMVMLAELAWNEVLSACGVPPGVFGRSDGTLARENDRFLLNHTIAPLGRLLQQECRLKLSDDIGIAHGELMSGDSQGKARAFSALVQGGMAVERAVILSGLMVEADP